METFEVGMIFPPRVPSSATPPPLKLPSWSPTTGQAASCTVMVDFSLSHKSLIYKVSLLNVFTAVILSAVKVAENHLLVKGISCSILLVVRSHHDVVPLARDGVDEPLGGELDLGLDIPTTILHSRIA